MTDKIFEQIAICDDPKLLKQWIKNGEAKGDDKIVRAARQRLFAILPAAQAGSLEHDVWMSILALEELESSRRGKTIRLQRTRNLIKKVGERECVERLLLKPAVSSGFAMLLEYDLPELLFEAVALRHPESFSDAAIENARNRLDAR